MAMTIEQQRALALARARLRAQESGGAQPQPQQGYNMAQDVGQAALSTSAGLVQGATLGAYDELAGALGTPLKAAEMAFGGRGPQGLEDIGPFIGRAFGESMAGQQAVFNQAEQADPAAFIAGDIAGSMALGGGMARSGASLLTNVANPTAANMMGRGALEGALYGAASGFNRGEDTGSRLGGAAIGGAGGAALGGLTGGIAGALASRQQTAAVPTTQQLFDDATNLYDAARQSGVQASQQQTQNLANTMRGIAQAEGIITPSGNVNQTYPKINSILNSLDDYSQGNMSVQQMQAMRRVLQDAAGSMDAGERRLGAIMLSEFDNFASGVAPELREASQLYARAKMGELIERTIELAGLRAGQFSNSGMENALRTEFRALERQLIKGQLKGVTPELADAISRVANGGSLQTFARNVGRFAPNGPVSFGMTAGVPFMVGNAIGGPGVGGAMSVGAMGAGTLGRAAAEGMAGRNAQIAAALARQGGALPGWSMSPNVARFLAAGGSQAGNLGSNVAR